jgi:hypothetical protein
MYKKNYIDYLVGLERERQLLPILKTHFNDDSIFQLTQYNTFDYKGDNKYIELKSRNNKIDKYDKTMVGYNKIIRASTILEDVYFFFWFTDGIFYWKYNKDINLEVKKGGRYDRGLNEINDYAYIPTSLLTKIII